ncbi:MAG: ATP-binding cassette domain-containing protein [Eggerthellaceae bacterium]|nr:ATP-binding cassette domain-containing protein [Eggerthellaceae bacterium]
MFCPNCGYAAADHMKFCANCGASLQGYPSQGMAGQAQQAGSSYASGGFAPVGYASNGYSSSGYASGNGAHLTFTVLQAGRTLVDVDLTEIGKAYITFGTDPDNDIVIRDRSKTVSRHHGAISLQGGVCAMRDCGSTNGLYMNGMRQDGFAIGPGDVITIGKQKEGRENVVLLVGHADMRWRSFDLSGRTFASIGRSPENDLALPFSTVSARHALLEQDQQGNWYITDNASFNGTFVDGCAIQPRTRLFPGSSLTVATVPMVFSGNRLFYTVERLGVDVTAFNLVRRRKRDGHEFITNDHISLHIKRGQFVAIAGGSGCGKTTLLNELVGNEYADEGTVTVDGVDLYANYNRLKNTIGYVPQQDIVYDNLTLVDMLRYGADLRMPPDSTKQEKEARINEIIELLELEGVRNNYISKMSGGQKKRASIAVELLADPRLLYLDEPTSGLDPGIEKSLMQKLSDLAKAGRTIILVTHTTLNLHLCDQIVLLGSGGKLCYAGPPAKALSFFGVEDFVDIYPKIGGQPAKWAGLFEAQRSERVTVPEEKQQREVKKSPSFISQLATLSARYVRLLLNDRARLVLLLAQAPLLAALICLVAGDGCFTEYESTKSCLFALSCAAFWVGILDAIQEICKERDIFTREYAGGMKLGSYVFSKVVVLGVLCVIQSLLLTTVFCLFKAPPSNALISAPLELFLSVFLITFSAMALGLLVSTLFDNPDRAIAMAPLLIMPQILFSGLVFKLEGVAKQVSLFVNCRWGMEALGTTANLNALDMKIYGEEITISEQETTIDEITTDVPSFDTEVDGMPITVPEQQDMTINDVTVNVPEDTTTIDPDMFPHDYEAMFDFATAHLMHSWSILLLFSVVCIAGCCIVLRVKNRPS